MVSRKALLIAAVMAVVVGALFPATASAFPNNILVGDESGWDLGVDYDKWALSVEIHAGDTLEFNYDPDFHNVVRVNEDGYNACDVTNNLGTWHSDNGDDFVQLPEAGKYFFICGTVEHCTRGPTPMKLAVTAAA